MKFLITGASGFIGRELVRQINKSGSQVFAISRSKSNNKKQFRLPKKNIKNFFKKVLMQTRPHYVIHLAGSITNQSLKSSLASNSILAYDLLRAIEECKFEKKTKTMIVGSAAEYGFISKKNLPVSEISPINPNNVYGISKSLQSFIVSLFMKSNNNIIYIRPFNVIGKGMSEHLSLGNFNKKINLIKKNKMKSQIDIRDSNAARDFIDVSDTVDIMLKLIKNKKAYGKYINICSGKSVKIKTVLKYMISISGLDIKISSSNLNKKNKDMSIYFGDNKNLIKLIGEFTFKSWRETVRKMMS